MLKRNSNTILLEFLLDWLSVMAAVTLAIWLRANLPLGQPRVPLEIIRTLYWQAGILYPLIFLLFPLYDPDRTFRAVDEYQILSQATLVAGLALAGLVYFTTRDISRLSLVYFYLAHFSLAIAWRGIARAIRQGNNARRHGLRRVLLIGGGETALQALQRLHQLSWAGVTLVGYLTDGPPIPKAGPQLPLLGNLDEAEKTVLRTEVDDVLVAMPAESYQRVQKILTRLMDKPCNIWVVPDYFSLLLYGSRVENLGDVPMISLKAPALTGYQRVVKRALDLILGSLLMIPALPVMGLVALAIRLDSPGPVLFKQVRVGENGHLFRMFKFRSMVKDADKRLPEVIRRDQEGNLVHKIENDPRITRVGRFIRRTSLDELPQLFNVLRGEMSLVGPRPELPILVENYQPWQHRRFAVPQGITGWWQVNGRSDKPMHLNTEDDLYYITNYSIELDFRILLKTVWVVLRGQGAY